jgi:hypothetical protein
VVNAADPLRSLISVFKIFLAFSFSYVKKMLAKMSLCERNWAVDDYIYL